MSAALHWHQHPGVGVRWALLWLVLFAHVSLLWIWSVNRMQTQVMQITPVRVVLVDRGVAPTLVTRPAVETPVQRPAPARQAVTAVTLQSPGATGVQVTPQVAQQSAPLAAPNQAPVPPPVSAQANVAPAKTLSAEPSAVPAAAVSPAGVTRDSGVAVSSTGSAGSRADVSMQTAAAGPAQGSGNVAAASGSAQSITDICPQRVKAVPPARATQAGLSGMVLARATIQGGKVRRVDILKSEPGGLYDAAVRSAMAQYVCRDQGAMEVLVEQRFEFKLAE